MRMPKPSPARMPEIIVAALRIAKELLKIDSGSIHNSTGYPTAAPANVNRAA
jgi:hypothetical protein